MLGYMQSLDVPCVREGMYICAFRILGGAALQSSQSRQNDNGTVKDAGTLWDICRA